MSGVCTIDDCMSFLFVTFCSFCLTAIVCMVCVWVHSKQSMFCTISLASQPMLVMYYMSACLNITLRNWSELLTVVRFCWYGKH